MPVFEQSGSTTNSHEDGYSGLLLMNAEHNLMDSVSVRAALGVWFSQGAGQRLLENEQQLFADQLANKFGYHLVQVGRLAGIDFLAGSRINQRYVLDLGGGVDSPCGYSSFRAKASELPIDSDCVDVVVLPHVLEFDSRPHEVLREASRILVPEGHLLISAFNPISLPGLWRLALRHQGTAPWCGHFFTQYRLRDWLELLGFELHTTHTLFYTPPLGNTRLQELLEPLDQIGRLLWPLFAGVHILSARKRSSTLTPIRSRQAFRRTLVGVSLAGPTSRVSRFDKAS